MERIYIKRFFLTLKEKSGRNNKHKFYLTGTYLGEAIWEK